MDDDAIQILLLAAMPGELWPLVRRLGLRPDGHGFGGDGVRARAIGVGPARAAERLEAVLREGRPDHVVLAGYAGGLVPGLAVGTVVPVHELVTAGDAAVRIGEGPGRCVSVAEPAATAQAKRELHARFAAEIVDMESYTVAKRVAALGIPLTVLRVVSDAADEAIPADVLTLTDRDGRPMPIRIVRCLARRPWRIAAMLRLARATRLAGAALADAVADHLDTLRA